MDESEIDNTISIYIAKLTPHSPTMHKEMTELPETEVGRIQIIAEMKTEPTEVKLA